jgi:hypothetical protein
MSSEEKILNLSRRRFLTRVLPACPLLGLGISSNLLAFPEIQEKKDEEPKHKFDEEFPQKLTNRQLATFLYTREYIPFLKFMSEEIGEERLIKLLKEHAAIKGRETGEMMAKRFGGNDFATLKKIFTPDSPTFSNTLTFTVTEDTESAYEIEVTECLIGSVFLKADAGKLGWASVCYGDYAMAEGFNPKISMVRDKTLTQGHSCCNHRYLFKA